MNLEALKTLASKVKLPEGTPLAARKDAVGEIYIYQDIGPADMGGLDAKTFVEAMAPLKGASTIQVRINSIGGSVFEAIAIYNTLKAAQAKIVVHVDGLAASSASVIAMAGDEIIMAPEAQMMVHEPWAVTAGNASNLRDMADLLDRNRDILVSIYEKRTGLAAAKVKSLLAAETWLTAKEAVDYGFADSIDGESAQIAASTHHNIISVAKETRRILSQHDQDLASMKMRALKHRQAASRDASPGQPGTKP